jgi:hypothetical protein
MLTATLIILITIAAIAATLQDVISYLGEALTDSIKEIK